jgi:hypothetical protein
MKVSFPAGRKGFFSTLQHQNWFRGPLNLLSDGQRRLFHQKQSGGEGGGGADHSTPSSANVKNGGAVPPLHKRLHGTVLN